MGITVSDAITAMDQGNSQQQLVDIAPTPPVAAAAEAIPSQKISTKETM